MIGQSAELLIALFAAHMLGDFLLQTTKDVENKYKLSVLARHTGLVAVASWVFCGLRSNWFIPVGIFIAHGLIDFVKSRLAKDGLTTFIIDQIVHFLVLIIMARMVTILFMPGPGFWVYLFGPGFLNLLVIFSGVVLATRVGGFLMNYMLKPQTKELEQAEKNYDEKDIFRGLTNSALIIGQLERTLILIFYLTGHVEGIGFLLAAKSLLRFGHVRNPYDKMRAEYFFIGTMMSYGFGILVAIVTGMVLGTL